MEIDEILDPEINIIFNNKINKLKNEVQFALSYYEDKLTDYEVRKFGSIASYEQFEEYIKTFDENFSNNAKMYHKLLLTHYLFLQAYIHIENNVIDSEIWK